MATLAKVVPIPKGNYSASATYNSLDIVRYNGKSWMCKQDSVTGITPAESAYWMLVVQDGGGATNLTSLDDVTVSEPANGQILLYNSTSGKWENKNDVLNSISDVNISGQTNGQVLVYNSTSGKWENTTLTIASTWSTLTGKPFSTIDTDHFTTTSDKLSVHMPEYYIEVNGDNLAGTYQTENEPVVLPAGALSKPFILILKNVGVTKDWTTRTQRFYVKESGSSTVYQMNVMTSSTSTYVGSTTNISLKHSYSNSSHSYSGDYIRLRYLPRESVITNNVFYNIDATTRYSPISKGSEIGTEAATAILSKNTRYMLYIYLYKYSTNAVYGCSVQFVAVPNVDSPTPKTYPIGSGGSTSSLSVVVSNEDVDNGKITVATTSNTYRVNYALYSIDV